MYALRAANGNKVVLKDEISGERLEVKPRIVVNATGAWIDFTNRSLGRQTQYIGGTKGSHLVLDHPDLLAATRGQMLYFANADGRICIFYPVYGKVIAGSTDIPVSDPEKAFCEEDEVDYILESVRQVFPTLPTRWTGPTSSFDSVVCVHCLAAIPSLPAKSVAIIAAKFSRRGMGSTFPYILWLAGSGPPSARLASKWRTRYSSNWQDHDRQVQSACPLAAARTTQPQQRRRVHGSPL